MSKCQNEKNIFIETLKWICNKLERADIPYMITGGSAVGFWGHIRTTMDIDVVIQINEKTIETFLKSIENDAYINIDKAKELISDRKMFNVIHNRTCFKVDIIALKDDIYEIEKFTNRVKINVQGKDIYVIGPEDLIISKLIWNKNIGGSERQIKDCASIYRLNFEDMNMDYLKKWTEKLGVKDEFDKLQ